MSRVVVVGSYIQDLAFVTETFPGPGETRLGTFQAGPGGKGFNQAVACCRMGVDTLFIGAVGEDVFGRVVEEFASRVGLKLALQRFQEHPTGAASIVVNAVAENLIVVAPGACDFLSPSFVAGHERELRGAEVVVCQAECNLEAVAKAFELAGGTRVLNPAPINPGLTAELIRRADILVPNETEFQFLLGHLYETSVEPDFWRLPDEELSQLCRLTGVPTVVLTLGSLGCVVHQGDGLWRVPALDVEPVDTTGAGDAFNGGLAAGLVLEEGALAGAARLANAVAGLSTTRRGTAPAMPAASEVRERLRWEMTS